VPADGSSDSASDGSSDLVPVGHGGRSSDDPDDGKRKMVPPTGDGDASGDGDAWFAPEYPMTMDMEMRAAMILPDEAKPVTENGGAGGCHHAVVLRGDGQYPFVDP
jgi:hypothetical protein